MKNWKGIGPLFGAKNCGAIADANGLFTDIEQIKNVSGIGDKKFEAIKRLYYGILGGVLMEARKYCLVLRQGAVCAVMNQNKFPDDMRDEILKAAIYAPSGSNNQS